MDLDDLADQIIETMDYDELFETLHNLLVREMLSMDDDGLKEMLTFYELPYEGEEMEFDVNEDYDLVQVLASYDSSCESQLCS